MLCKYCNICYIEHYVISTLMPRSYPIIKEMHKSFRYHPEHGYLIERWEFEPRVKWWDGDTRPATRKVFPSRWSRAATGR